MNPRPLTRYRYRACNAQGHIVTGHMEALHEADLSSQLQRLGLTLMRARTGSHLLRRQATAESTRNSPGRARALPARELINFLFQLEMQLRAGIPLLSILSELAQPPGAHDQYGQRGQHERPDREQDSPRLRQLAASLLHSIENGATLSEACQNQPASFSPVNCQLIRAGELSGQLPEVLQAMVHSLKWQDEILSKTRKLLIYPCFILFVILAVAFFLLTHLLPQLAGFLQGMAGAQALPMQTRALMALSALLTEHGWLLLSIPVVSALLLAALYHYLPGLRQRLHRMLLQLPYLGSLLRKSILARLANNFALLYRSGIPVLDTLSCCQQLSANLEIQHTMARVHERIAQGASISSSFAAEKIFPALFIRMLKVGESTGELDRALNNIDYFYSRDMEESIARIQAMIEPSMSIIMALLLGSIMLSVFGPLYDSISSISF